jgi:hypothetical protein
MTRPLGVRTITCAECGANVTAAMSNHRKYCDDCAPKVRKRSKRGATYRTLSRGEVIPEVKPLRYKDETGYIHLRWTVTPTSFETIAEHRVFDGRVSMAEQVHHINFIRDDNRRENLLEVTVEEHQAIHRAEDRRRHREMKALYEAGKTTTEIAGLMGANHGNVYRALVRQGATIRTATDYAKPVPTEEIIRRFKGGEGVRSIRRDLGMSHDRITRELEANGIPRRKPGRVPASAVS